MAEQNDEQRVDYLEQEHRRITARRFEERQRTAFPQSIIVERMLNIHESGRLTWHAYIAEPYSPGK